MRIAPDSPLGAQILQFEAQRQAALISADPLALDRVLHADLIHVHSTGLVQDKATFIAHLSRIGGFIAITRGTLDLRAVGEAVLISGPTVNRVRKGGHVVDLAGHGSVLVLRGPQGWQVVLSQITPASNG